MGAIAEDYVGFETAKLLKKKGFDECIFEFYEGNKIKYAHNGKGFKLSELGSDIYYPHITHQMTMKWLREEKCLYIHIGIDLYKFDEGEIKFFIEYYSIKAPFKSYSYEGEHIYFDNYEQTCEEAIKYCLKHLI